MNAELNADDDTTEITIDFTGAVRTLADQHAGSLQFHGLEETSDVFGSYSTVIAVRNEAEVEAALDVLKAVRRDEDLTAGQKRALRRVEGKLHEARAEFEVAKIEAAAEAEDDEDDDGDGWTVPDEVVEAPENAQADDGSEDDEQVEVVADGGVDTDEALEAVEDAKGVRSSVLSNNTRAKVAEDGRVFVQFSVSHGYGRSNGLNALQDLDDSFAMTYNPHGATQWAAQTGEGMLEDAAEAFVTEGAEFVSVRGYHVRIENVKETGRIEASYPSSEFGDSRGTPKAGRLVEQLVAGTATPLNVSEVLGDRVSEAPTGEVALEDDEDDGAASDREVCTDGGRETEFVEGEFVDVQADDGEVYTAVVEDVEVEDEATTYWIEFEDEAPAYGAHCGTDLFVESCGTAYGTADALERHGQGEVCTDGGRVEDDEAADEAEARLTQAAGEAKLALEDPADADEATAPFTAMGASASDVFEVCFVDADGDRHEVVTEVLRVGEDGIAGVEPVEGGRWAVEVEDLERIEWYGPLTE